VEASHRVSDADRERTVVLLRDHLLAGRLTLDEFSERVERAYGARLGQELVRLCEDLPDIPPEAARSRRKPTRLTVAFFGHVARRGRLKLRRWTLAVAAFADLDLDLREAEFDKPRTAVTVLVAFANADIYVPEGVNVDIAGVTVFGRRREWGADVAHPDAPTLHVRTLGVFGTVDIWRVPEDMRGSYSQIFRRLKKRQRELPAQTGRPQSSQPSEGSRSP
jgi:Domain of unknown function (DUF1707)